jgi:hypothetical protein
MPACPLPVPSPTQLNPATGDTTCRPCASRLPRVARASRVSFVRPRVTCGDHLSPERGRSFAGAGAKRVGFAGCSLAFVWRAAVCAEVTPLLWRIVTVLGITMYVLAIVGVEAFTGVLSQHDPLVAASSYGVNGQWALNYDVSRRVASWRTGLAGKALQSRQHATRQLAAARERRRLPKRTWRSLRCSLRRRARCCWRV